MRRSVAGASVAPLTGGHASLRAGTYTVEVREAVVDGYIGLAGKRRGLAGKRRRGVLIKVQEGRYLPRAISLRHQRRGL